MTRRLPGRQGRWSLVPARCRGGDTRRPDGTAQRERWGGVCTWKGVPAATRAPMGGWSRSTSPSASSGRERGRHDGHRLELWPQPGMPHRVAAHATAAARVPRHQRVGDQRRAQHLGRVAHLGRRGPAPSCGSGRWRPPGRRARRRSRPRLPGRGPTSRCSGRPARRRPPARPRGATAWPTRCGPRRSARGPATCRPTTRRRCRRDARRRGGRPGRRHPRQGQAAEAEAAVAERHRRHQGHLGTADVEALGLRASRAGRRPDVPGERSS